MEKKDCDVKSIKQWDPNQPWEEIPVRTRINAYFNKRDIVFGNLDLLEKMCRQAEMNATICLQEDHLKNVMQYESENTERIKQVESTLEWLKSHYAWAEEMWQQGAFALQYNHHITMENVKLRHENAELKKENETLKKQIEF
ncbi:MAG: hypothetical protein V4549_06510 [Bacteroidota bacterium]